MTRKLASIRKIDEIRPIADADAIECAVVGGWTVVVKKGEYKAGDLAVYCEIDSWIPTEIAPFLSKGKEPREFEGVKGDRLRTMKLRGQLSQGLLLPVNEFFGGQKFEGEDVSEALNIIKWEAPIPAQLAGQVRGNFPGFIPKTDQERVQNLESMLSQWTDENFCWEVTEKLDGSSMTVYLHDDVFGVCSRNLDLTETEGNSFWRAARENGFEEKLRDLGASLAIQGELIGDGIQGNPYKIKGQKFYVFDIYDIKQGSYVHSNERNNLINTHFKCEHVPIIGAITVTDNMQRMLDLSEGKSLLCKTTEREGLVFKSQRDPNTSFKIISNKFLLKNGG